MRIVVDHAYHGIDYERVWRTLRDDVPELDGGISQWMGRELGGPRWAPPARPTGFPITARISGSASSG